MRSQSLLVLAAAVFLGLIAVIVANLFLDEGPPQTSATQDEAGMTTIVVASTPLFFGSAVGNEHLKVVKWPSEAVPPGAFRNVAAVLEGGQRRVALRAMEVNEPILASKVSGKGGRLSMSGLIAPDMRAATIRVNDVVGVGGFLLPGDRVDIMITRTIDGGTGVNAAEQTITDVLLQGVRVVGVDQDANEAKDKPSIVKTVTVEVTQEQAQKLALGQQIGSLNLALRNLTNAAPDQPKTVHVADLRYGATGLQPALIMSRPARRRIARVSTDTVQVVRGLEQSSYQVRRHAGL